MSETTTDQDRTMTFPNVVARRFAEAAIDRERERQIDRRRITDVARIAGRFRLGHHLEMGEATYVFEVIGPDDTVWGVILGARDDHYRFYTLDEALLRAVELRNGGDGNSQGHVYAARMLGVGLGLGDKP